MALTAVIPADAGIQFEEYWTPAFAGDGLYSVLGAGNEALRCSLPSASARPRPSSARAA